MEASSQPPHEAICLIREAINNYRDALLKGDRMTRDIRAGHQRMLLEALIEKAISPAPHGGAK